MPSSSPRLYHIANPWSLVGHPPGKTEWSLERKLKAIKDAGFDGFTARLTPEHRKWAEKLDLYMVGYFASSDATEFDGLLQEAKVAGARHVNVQLGDHDTPTPQALRLARALVKSGRKLGMEPAIEVHRDTCTETPEKTYALADAFQKATGELLPITWDYSHLAVVKHLAPPFHDRLLVRPDLIQRAQQFHLRPFNGHHCQVPVTNGRGQRTPELEAWLPFVEKLLACWLEGNRSTGREIFIVPEMGPLRGGYNLSILPNSWKEAIALREILDQTWKKIRRRQPKK
jgi:sugar phosphate isomerase/epimerase